VVIAAPATPETRGLFDDALFAVMKRGAHLVNIARGAIVDEAAMLAELASGRLRAALDAFAVEPLPADSPLRGMPNVVPTPHSAGSSRQSRQRIWQQMSANLERLARGQPLLNVVNGLELPAGAAL
jgi:phosphoglycerate dehydrogenase-like enzyme